MSNAKNLVVAVVLGLVVAWRSAFSAADIVAEARRKARELPDAFTLSERARIARELGRLEAARGVEPGGEAALYAALEEHVRPDAMLFLVNKNVSVRRFLAFTHMNVLFYPRHFFLTAGLPPNWRAAMANMGERCYVIEHGPERHRALAEVCERLADGNGFVLWHYRGRK